MKIHRIPVRGNNISLRRLRVAAYCRVSTKHAEQKTSYQLQQEYYRWYISSHANWTLVDIYADQASGGCNKRMDQFQKLMDDCRTNRIDLILVKSITRMGRNTLELLQCMNELKAIGVDVDFETEQIHLNDPKATLLLTVYSSFSQNESENKSMNITWGIRKGFADGTSRFAMRPCYGYCKDENGNLVIDKPKAQVIRRIFKWYEEGNSLCEISKKLYEEGVVSPTGKHKWGAETLRKILNNEKYHGDVLLQKTFVANFFTGKQRENKGELDRYYTQNSHMAIVEKQF